jgi:hypothetical protein
MSVIKSVIQEELERSVELQDFYSQAIEKLPKGSIVKKLIRNNTYFYLKFRNGNKVHMKYLGKPGDEITKLEKQISERRAHEKTLKELKSEYKILLKMSKAKG